MNEQAFISVEGRQRLERVAQWLEAGGKHITISDENGKREINEFNMADTVTFKPECGTACCIAGAVCQFEQPFTIDDLTESFADGTTFVLWDADGGGVMERATDLLGISHDDAYELFVPDFEYETGVEMEAFTAEQGAQVIRHYLETGEVIWEDLAHQIADETLDNL